MGRYGSLWVAMGHFSPPLGQTSQRPKPLKGVGMGWPMGWDEMGSKTGSKRHFRMTYAGPIQEPPGAARRSHPGLSRQRQAIIYDPAGTHRHAPMYMAALA